MIKAVQGENLGEGDVELIRAHFNMGRMVRFRVLDPDLNLFSMKIYVPQK